KRLRGPTRGPLYTLRYKCNATRAMHSSQPPKTTPPERSGAIAVELPISIRGPRQSSPADRRRPRLCARSSWRHQTLACGCQSSPHPVVSIPTMADNAPIMVIVPAKGGGFAAAKRQEIAALTPASEKRTQSPPIGADMDRAGVVARKARKPNEFNGDGGEVVRQHARTIARVVAALDFGVGAGEATQ